MALNTIEEIIDDIRQGKMVIIMDDEDRENEGDLIMASSMVRAEDINFMARYGRGLICLTLTTEKCQQLRLPLMVSDNNAPHSTNFTVSVEAAQGVTTGISAADRAVTVRTAASNDCKPEDLVQPGHIFPLRAEPGGVLSRAGHTEAGCDLARLAGMEASSVIVEVLNEDGTMARRPDLEKFAEEHNLKIGTIADLIHYRIEKEKNIERVAECELPTEHGQFHLYAYQDAPHKELHFALTYGEIDGSKPVLVRVHMSSAICDVIGSLRGDCGWPLKSAMKCVAKEGAGIIVILRQTESASDLVRRIHDYQIHPENEEHHEPRESQANTEPHEAIDLRTYGIGAQILNDLGVHQMRVLSAPKKMPSLSGFDLEVVEYVSCE